MKIINLPRGKGKTTRLIYASEFNDTPILCENLAYKRYLIYEAERLGLDIPEPITVSDLVSDKLKSTDYIDKDILIDEAPWVLQNLLRQLGMRGEVKAITLTEREEL